MHSKLPIVFGLVASLACATHALAGPVPKLLQVQGSFLSQAGVPVDGTYAVTFSLHTAETGGAQLWSEPQSGVVVAAGVFDAVLGASVALPDTVFQAGDSLWLQTQVASEPPLPRRRVLPAAFAYFAEQAATAGGLTCTGCVKDGMVGFNYAGAASKGGPATSALTSSDLACSGACVESSEVSFPYAGSDAKGGKANVAVLAEDLACPKCVGTGDIALEAVTPDRIAPGTIQALGFTPGPHTPAYVLPMASATVLGGVKVGANVQIDGSGFISAKTGATTGTVAPGDHGHDAVYLKKDGDASTLANLPAGPNLLRDTRLFTGMSKGSVGAPWSVYSYNTETITVSVEDPPDDFYAAVLPNHTWWERDLKVLRVTFTNTGASPGRILQLLSASAKDSKITASAWIKVLQGGVSFGQEFSWATHTNTSWKWVQSTVEPTKTLGGAYGFAALPSTSVCEVLIALPKVELGGQKTPWLENPADTAAVSIETDVPSGPNLLHDTRMFYALQDGAVRSPWAWFSYDTASFQVTVEDAPAELLSAALPGHAWWSQAFKVLHVKFNGTGASGGRILQLLTPSVKGDKVTSSAWVKVISGGIYVGHEFSWALTTSSDWTLVKSVVTPSKTLGGAYGFGALPNTGVSEALIAFPKVELGGTASPWTDAPDDLPRGNFTFTCTPAWSQSTTGTKKVLCETTVTTTRPSIILASVTGHWQQSGAHCSLWVEVDDSYSSLPGDPSVSPAHSYATSWESMSDTRVVSVGPGVHAVRYAIWSPGTCWCNGSSLSGIVMPQ